jgi:hypothetical protein
MSSWQPRNKKPECQETAYKYFGTCNSKVTQVLVYGDKPDATSECEKPREPQSRRAINEVTLAQMIRGECGHGEIGIDALAPLGGGREVVDVTEFGSEESPYREEYFAACQTVADEMGEDAPEWLVAETEKASL